MQSDNKVYTTGIMDSFKLYLPSNASMDRFPKNEPSNFRTQFSNPIQLQGMWEAGVESIFYSSSIGDKKEKAMVELNTKVKPQQVINDLYPFPFKLSKTNTWLGYQGATPTNIAKSSLDISQVVECLNSVNENMLRNPGQRIFEFSVHQNKVIYNGFRYGITIHITRKMAKYLGFNWKNIFTGFVTRVAPFKRRTYRKLTKEDYRVWYFQPSLLRRQRRVMIKWNGSGFPVGGVRQVLKNKWEYDVQKLTRSKISFRMGKLLLQTEDDNAVLIFSSDFAKTFGMKEPIIGSTQRWGRRKFNQEKQYYEGEWYVDVYSDEMETVRVNEYQKDTFSFEPRSFDNVDAVVSYVNQMIFSKLKELLGPYYDAKMHQCELSLHQNHTKIVIGKWLVVQMSKNLSLMFGFDQNSFTNGEHTSSRLAASLKLREQRLFILSDFIQPVSYGNEQLPVMQEFIHEVKDTDILEKRFQPISYIPLSHTTLPSVHIELVNELHQPVKIKDSKTMLILHFRKVK